MYCMFKVLEPLANKAGVIFVHQINSIQMTPFKHDSATHQESSTVCVCVCVPRSHSFPSVFLHFVDKALREPPRRGGCRNNIHRHIIWTVIWCCKRQQPLGSYLSARTSARQQPNPFIISPLNFCTFINMLFEDAAVILRRSPLQTRAPSLTGAFSHSGFFASSRGFPLCLLVSRGYMCVTF